MVVKMMKGMMVKIMTSDVKMMESEIVIASTNVSSQ